MKRYVITEDQLKIIKEKVFKEDYHIKINTIINRINRFMSKLSEVLKSTITHEKEYHGEEYHNSYLEIYKNSQDPQIKEKLKKGLNLVYSLIDKGTKKNVFHKNTAARKKAQLAAHLKLV
jgi:ribosomal protein S20